MRRNLHRIGLHQLKRVDSFVYLSLFFSGFIFSNIHAQTNIKGVVLDSATYAPLSFSTIIIKRRFETNRIYLSSSSNDSGQFKLKVDTGVYLVAVSFVGYINKEMILTVNDEIPEMNLGNILLSEKKQQLKGVTVRSQNALYEFLPGKIVYDIENDPRVLGKNGLEVLRMAPLVSITGGGGSIQLRGKSNFVLQMNGKTFLALSSNPTDFLQSIDQNQISKIEIITNPSAKYSAEGPTGIINIITKKNSFKNFGSINIGYDTYNNSLFGLNLAGKKNKIGYSLVLSENFWRNGTYDYILSQQIVANSVVVSGHTLPKRNNFYGTGSMSYQWNKNTILNIDINSFAGKGNINQTFTNKNQIVKTNNLLKNRNFSIGTDLEKKIDSITSFVFSYKYENQISNSEIQYIDSSALLPSNKGISSENTFQLDFKRKNLEFGSKAILRLLNSEIIENDPETNDFNFKQNVYAAYISFNKTFHGFNFEGGLREEYTYYKGLKKIKDSIFYADKYAKLFPTISIDRTFTNTKTNLSFGYSKRISRPQLYYLNPFINSANPYFFASGNLILKPELSNNFELRLSNQGKNFSSNFLALSYQYSRNSIIKFLYPFNDSVINSSYVNFKNQYLLGLSFYSSFSIAKKIQINFSNNLYWTLYPNSVLIGLNSQGYRIGNNGFFGSIGLTLSGTFLKKLRWSFINTFNLPEVYIQGKGSSFLYQDITFSIPLAKNKIFIYSSIRQPFIYKYDYRTSYSTIDFIQVANNRTPQRRLFIGLRYSFGKPLSTNVRTRKKINNEDKKTKNTLDNIK